MSTDRFGIVGTTIDGRYAIEEVVGEGGFGVVYRAAHVRFAERFAVKVLKIPHSLTAEQHAALLEAFDSEARHLRALSNEHSAFVRAVDVGQLPLSNGSTTPYLVLEWLDGEPLSRDLARRRKSGRSGRRLSEALALLSPIAEALSVAHQRKVAHRDVKPANIHLALDKGRVAPKLLDLGVAKVMTETGTGALSAPTQGPALGFSPEYAAPEQWNKKLGATGPWTDVYAFALVLVELLTDRRALDGETQAELMRATLDPDDRPTARNRGLLLPPAVDAALERALALAVRERYRSMHEFWSALQAAVGRPSGGIEPTLEPRVVKVVEPATVRRFTEPMPTIDGTTAPLAAPSPVESALPAPAPTRYPYPSTRRGSRIIQAGAIGILIVVFGVLLSRQLGSRPSSGSPPAESPNPSGAPSTYEGEPRVVASAADRSAPPPPLSQTPPKAASVPKPNVGKLERGPSSTAAPRTATTMLPGAAMDDRRSPPADVQSAAPVPVATRAQPVAPTPQPKKHTADDPY